MAYTTTLLHRYKVLGILYADDRAIEAVGIRALPVAVKADSAASADVGVRLAQ